jgi:hypothetical protein
MPQVVVRQGHTRVFGLAAAIAMLALVPASPASAGDRNAVVFKPAKTSTKAVTFRVHGVNPRSVLRGALVRDGKIRRRIGRERAQRVVRRGVLRVPIRTSKSHRRAAEIVGHAGARSETLWVRRVARRSVKLKVVADTRAPETRITSAPPETTDSHEAEFRFTADEKRATFECRVDSFEWRSCTSPILYVEVPDGEHTFGVRARDRFGNVDATAAVRAWTVDSDVTEEPADPTEPDRDEATEDPTPSSPTDTDTLLFDDFTGPDGVITNHYAFWSPDDQTAFRDDIWEMESGCARRRDNTLWTGIPTSGLPNKDCSNGSGSEVFRLWTKRSFRDVNVTFSLRNNGFVSGAEGQRSWDGIKIWLRRQGGTGSVGLYTAEVNRRQGNLMIQKKCAGSDTYHILNQGRPEGSAPSIDRWEKVGGSITNQPDGSVRITLMRHGQTVLEATDRGVGCDPYRTGGRVGIRGDYTNFNADDFLVVPAV